MTTTEPKRRRGKLTTEMADLLVECERKGLTRKDMCSLAGVSTAVLAIWLSDGRQGKRGPKFKIFADRFDRATAELSRDLLGTIHKSATGGIEEVKTETYDNGRVKRTVTQKPDPQMAARLLRYKDPDTYKELFGSDKASVSVTANKPKELYIEYIGKPGGDSSDETHEDS